MLPVLGYLMQVRCPTVGENGEADFIAVDHVKLFRNLPELRFEGRIHEQILLPIRRLGGSVPWTDIFVVHSGADTSPEGRARKLERDLRILELERRERPDHPFTLFNLGMTCAEVGRQEEAIAFLWQSIGRSGSDDSHLRKAYALLASCYRNLGRHETALETCQQGLERFPLDAELWFRQGMLLHQFGRLREAAGAYESLLYSQEERHLSSVAGGIKGFRGRHNLAVVYAQMGELARAEDQWRLVVQQAPHFRLGWRGLGEVLLRQAKLSEARAVLEQVPASTGPPRSEDRMLYSHVLAAQGDIRGAADELERAVAEYPEELQLLQTLCQLLFERGEPADARQAIARLIERSPQDAAAYHNLGSVYYRLGQYEASADNYRHSLELRPNWAPTYVHLGYTLRESGKPDEAAAAWQQALALAPGDPAATQALEQLQSLSRT